MTSKHLILLFFLFLYLSGECSITLINSSKKVTIHGHYINDVNEKVVFHLKPQSGRSFECESTVFFEMLGHLSVLLTPEDTLRFFDNFTTDKRIRIESSRNLQDINLLNYLFDGGYPFSPDLTNVPLTDKLDFNYYIQQSLDRNNKLKVKLKHYTDSVQVSKAYLKVVEKTLFYKYLNNLLTPYFVDQGSLQDKDKLRAYQKLIRLDTMSQRDSDLYLFAYCIFIINLNKAKCWQWVGTPEEFNARIQAAKEFTNKTRDYLIFKILVTFLSQSVASYNKEAKTFLGTCLTKKYCQLFKQRYLDRDTDWLSKFANETVLTHEQKKMTVSEWLNSMHTQYVYIRCWLPGCEDCKYALTHNELQFFRNNKRIISFINLCVDSNVKDWRNYINGAVSSKKIDSYYFLNSTTQFARYLKIQNKLTVIFINLKDNILLRNVPVSTADFYLEDLGKF